MSAFVGMPDELIGAVEMSKSGDRNAAVYALALQLPFLKISESMGNHDSKIVGACSVD